MRFFALILILITALPAQVADKMTIILDWVIKLLPQQDIS